MFRTVPLSIIRSSFTVHSAMVYVIQVCRRLSSMTRMELQFHPGHAWKLSTNLYDIYHCWVYSEWTPGDGQTNCPKHVEFHAKNNICEISAFSWFYYKEICFDARSHGCKILTLILLVQYMWVFLPTTKWWSDDVFCICTTYHRWIQFDVSVCIETCQADILLNLDHCMKLNCK